MKNEYEIAQFAKKIHKELYGNSSLNSVFGGGNIGLMYLGECIVKASENISEALKEQGDNDSDEKILDVIIDTPDFQSDQVTLRDYLKELLCKAWNEAESFSGKRPFGNSGWQYDVYASLLRDGIIEGKLDEDGYVEEIDIEKADKLITELIVEFL